MFDAENTTQDVVVLLRNDQVFELTETFFVDLMQLDGTLCNTATVFIQDDDQPQTTLGMLIECTSTVTGSNFIKLNTQLMHTPTTGNAHLSCTTVTLQKFNYNSFRNLIYSIKPIIGNSHAAVLITRTLIFVCVV